MAASEMRVTEWLRLCRFFGAMEPT